MPLWTSLGKAEPAEIFFSAAFFITEVRMGAKLPSFRAALAGLKLGGGKPWIVVNSLPPPELSQQLLRRHRPLRKWLLKSQICIRRSTRHLRKPLRIE